MPESPQQLPCPTLRTTRVTAMPKLPVVAAPGLEEKLWNEDPNRRVRPLLSIEDRCGQIPLVLLQSMKQSRQTWLNNVLTKYIPTQQPPPQASLLGTCDLEVGPHIFPETRFFEITNLTPVQPTYPPVTFHYPPPSVAGPSSFSGPYYYHHFPNAYPQPSFPAPDMVSVNERHGAGGTSQSKPLTIPTSGPSYPPTPVASSSSAFSVPQQPSTSVLSPSSELVARVDRAARTDKALAELLSIESDRDPTQEERELLAKRIVEVAGQDRQSPSPSVALSPSPWSPPTLPNSPQQLTQTQRSPYSSPFQVPYHTGQSPTNSFSANTEILVEFTENASDRFILPLSSSIVERSITNSAELDPITGRPVKSLDILISTVLPASVAGSRAGVSKVGGPKLGECYPVTIKLVGASSTLWLAVSKKVQYKNSTRTSGIAKVLHDMLNFVPTRVYLQQRLPEGLILNGIRDVVFDGRNPFKRKEPSSTQPAPASSEPATKKPKYPTRPSGRQVEVVIPLRRRSVSASTSSSQASLPSQGLNAKKPYRTKPTPGLKVEVVIPLRKKRPAPTRKPRESPSTPKTVTPVTPTEASTATAPQLPPRPTTPTRPPGPRGLPGMPNGQIPYSGYYTALSSAYSPSTYTYPQGAWLYPWSPGQPAPYYYYGQTQRANASSSAAGASQSEVPFTRPKPTPTTPRQPQ
ncbi:hypothetical protein FRC05_009903 [Tulasnella sp. 425]|nr:hypothetical protein FRC05_009903 [Tulasnella sp. 425]